MDCDEASCFDFDCKPSDIVKTTKEHTLDHLPTKSKERYEFAYQQFETWRKRKQINSTLSENVFMEYFEDLSTKISPNTLWTQYSMLKSTMIIRHGIDMTNYIKLKAFIKRKSLGYKPKKSKTFTNEEIYRYIREAPDEIHLLNKMVLIVGISGACRKHELIQLTVDNIKDLGSAVLMTIPDTNTRRERSFIITGEFYNIYKKYAALRPPNLAEKRFFLNYQNQKCTRQVVGINKIGSTPRYIATYLGLEEPQLYTGHCYRRSSTTILGNTGGGIPTTKPHEDEKSAPVSESCIEDSLQTEIKIEDTTNDSTEDSEPPSSPLLNEMEPKLIFDGGTPILTGDGTIPKRDIHLTLPATQHPLILYNCSNNNITINFINNGVNK